jgi:hypothetical protein
MNARSFVIAVVIFAFVSLASVVEAGPFGLFGRRNQRSMNDGNAVSEAPIAPAGLGSQPCMECQNGRCMLHQPQAVPAPIVASPVPASTMVEVPQAYSVDVVRSVGGTVLVDDHKPMLEVDARIERLISALENRLGIQADAAIQGSTTQIFDSLPVIEIVRKNQKGEVEGKAVFNTKLWIEEQLSQ